MPSEKKPIIVRITERAHKPKKGKPAQPWTVRIEYPGNKPADEVQERYTRPYSAKMGGARKLKAKRLPFPNWDKWTTPDGRQVVFVITPKKK